MGKPKGSMRYDKDTILEQAKEAIIKNNLFFITDVYGFIACGKTKFHELFPADSPEMTEMRELLDVNKIQTKAAIRAKLFKSEKASELLALYRLVCTPEEHRLLNQQYVETKGDNKPLQVIINEQRT